MYWLYTLQNGKQYTYEDIYNTSDYTHDAVMKLTIALSTCLNTINYSNCDNCLEICYKNIDDYIIKTNFTGVSVRKQLYIHNSYYYVQNVKFHIIILFSTMVALPKILFLCQVFWVYIKKQLKHKGTMRELVKYISITIVF